MFRLDPDRLPPQPTSRPTPPESSKARQYAAKKVAEAARNAAASRAGRDLGELPPIADVRRRARCRKSLRKFCETYQPEAFCLGWSDDHLKAIARIEEAATLGALFAFAMPRGSGKTSICRAAALWALAYQHARYVYVIGANAAKAGDTLEAIKIAIRYLPDFAADFPEIAYPVARLGGIANRAGGQTQHGESTLIDWSKDRLVMPTVGPPPNWPKAWPLRADGKAPSSGSVLSVSGLTGDGIRGSLIALTTGESLRPDLVLIDDPQSAESSASASQNATRLQLVSADVLGMAGPGKTIAGVMPCTVITRADFIDQILDRSRHPMWRGERTKLLRTMPANMAAWDDYCELYKRCALLEPPDFAAANDHYVTHRAALDAGAEASWAERKLPGEISAVQHAMHLYVRDPRAFMSEYQNDPVELDAAKSAELVPSEIVKKLNRVPRMVVPRECTRLTAGIDVHGNVLYYCVTAWDERFGGAVVDYGTWPRQNRSYFTQDDPRPSIADKFPGLANEAAVYKALTAATEDVLGREYAQAETGAPMRVARCLIDSGWETETVYQFCRQNAHAAQVLPSKGHAVTAAGRPMAEWQRRPGERIGWNWRVGVGDGKRGKVAIFDPNPWKSFVAERLHTPHGAPGCLSIFGGDPHVHQLFGDHMGSEYCVQTTGRGRTVDAWSPRPGKPDNHWWDALVMTCVAASEQGLTWQASGEPAKPKVKRAKVDIEELYRSRSE